MFERLKSVFSRNVKESRSWNAILSLGYHGPQFMGMNYQSFAREGYTWNPDVYACINAKVRAIRGIEFAVFKKKGKSQQIVTDGPLADLVKHPNARQSWSSLIGDWVGAMEISGNAYLEGVSPGSPDSGILKSAPVELFALRPDRMFVVPGDARVPVAGYEYRAGSTVVPYMAQLWRDPRVNGLRPRLPVMHSKYFHPLDDWYGLSPVQAASRNIDASNSSLAWNVSLTQNVARPSGIFSSDQTISAERAEEYTNLIRQKFSGPGNAGRPLVLGMGYKWQQMGMSPQEMDWIKSLEWNTTKICAVYGVPPEIIGDSAHRTYSNFSEARKAFYLETCLPACDILCDDLNNWLAPLFFEHYKTEVFIGYVKDSIEAIQAERAIQWKNAVEGSTFLTVNEQRALLGYEPIEDGDRVMVPINSVPLAIAGAQRQMPNQPGGSIGAQSSSPKPGSKPGKKDQNLIEEIGDIRLRLKALSAPDEL